MGSGRKGLFLMFLTCICTLASSSSLQKALPSDSLQEINLEDKRTYIHGTGDGYIGGNRRRGIIHSRKIARGGANGGRPTGSSENGGGSTGSSENGNGGAQGGAAVIPIYAAGAANKHPKNTHHSSGSCSRNCVGLPTMTMSILASLAFNFYVG